jgi:exosortase
VQNLATAHTLTTESRLSRKEFPLALVLSIFFLAALWFGLCRELSGEWSVNEQYNFGWFVPFFALYLFWLRWQDAPAAQIANRKSQIANSAAPAIAISALLILLPVRLFEIANPEWRLLAWTHASAVVALTLLLIWWAGGKTWLRHFAFPVAFIFVAVPWPTALEMPVIQGLMRVVARVAAETAMLLGTPAQVEGSLIRVSNGLVGVNEACSGIRSLQTSLMIGLLFGEVKRLSVPRRLALVLCAVMIALLANFVRAVFLVQIAATENLSEVGRWHGIAGYTIIAVVFVATMALAYLLGKKRRNSGFQSAKGRTRRGEPEPSGSASSLRVLQTGCPLDESGRMPALQARSAGRWSPFRSSYLAAVICWLLFVEIGSATWYRFHEHDLVSGAHWTVRWPEQAPNFRKLKIDAEVRAVLRFDKGDAAAWTLAPSADTAAGAPADEPPPDAISCLLYLFRWNPGKNSALLANLHRPDVCLPASGWKQVADHGARNYPVSGSVELPFRHFEFQRSFEGSLPQTAHAFYCLSEDRASAISSSHANANGWNALSLTRWPSAPGMFGNRSEWTRTERLDAVLQGRRHLGQQVIEAMLISNEPFSADQAESQLRRLVRDVVVLRSPEKN